jgi:myosin heavy subunit
MDIVLLLLLNVFFLTIMYLLLRRQVDKTYNQKEFLNKVEAEISAIMTEMNQTTDRNLQLLENRLTSLKEMIQKADEVIKRMSIEYHSYKDRLEKKNHVLPTNGQSLNRLYGVDQGSKTKQTSNQSTLAIDDPAKILNQGSPLAEPLEPESSRSNHSEIQTTSMIRESSREDRKAKVLQHLLEGLNPQEIAEKTGFSIAEIELILALTKR